MFALDTNTVIYALKGAGGVRERLERCSPSVLAIPAIVAYELEWGTLRSAAPERRRRELRRLLSVVRVLPFDEAAASQAAGVCHALEKAGERIGPLDTLIAGTALAFGATLVTHNVKEFGRVPGLRVEDWY